MIRRGQQVFELGHQGQVVKEEFGLGNTEGKGLGKRQCEVVKSWRIIYVRYTSRVITINYI